METALIPATSEKQAMDWSLALASQGMACVIHPPSEGRGWALEVDRDDATRALRTLRLYHVENRRWATPLAPEPAGASLLFHWGVLLWCFLMALVFWASEAPASRLGARGTFDTAATAAGDWWRPATATFLHSGPDHLAANLTWGFLLLGLAMGRLGPGTALLATLAAGTAGNLLAWSWRGHPYVGLGASGVVMAALGVLAIAILSDARAGRISRGTLTRSILGGLLLFILVGTSPQSDVLAHLGGLLAGALTALGLSRLPAKWMHSPRWDLGCAAAYLAIAGAIWAAALR